jgi:hypothetical protein
VSCIVRDGDLPLKINWSVHGKTLSSVETLGISTMKMGLRTSILMIDAVTAAHSGTYRCLASNEVGEDSYSAELRVIG